MYKVSIGDQEHCRDVCQQDWREAGPHFQPLKANKFWLSQRLVKISVRSHTCVCTGCVMDGGLVLAPAAVGAHSKFVCVHSWHGSRLCFVFNVRLLRVAPMSSFTLALQNVLWRALRSISSKAQVPLFLASSHSR